MNAPSSGPRKIDPSLVPAKDNPPTSPIHSVSRGDARRRTVNPIGAASSARYSVHAGSGIGSVSTGTPTRNPARRVPRANPKPMARNVPPAPASRAVPDTRFRVASSIIATVSENPGMRTIRPATVAV
jgi:hypothetical protein